MAAIASPKIIPTAIDLFSGCGGLTTGLSQAGFEVIGAVEMNNKAAETYNANHPKTFLFKADITSLEPEFVMRSLNLRSGELHLLAGCPPCQGFSRLGNRNGKVSSTDVRNDLVTEFVRFANVLRPQCIMLENVPALENDQRFRILCRALENLGYHLNHSVLDVADYGVPQRRKRLILLGSLHSEIKLALPTKKRRTVRDAIGKLGLPNKSKDGLHSTLRSHSKKVFDLIKAIPKDGGSRSALSKRMTLACHKRQSGFRDVYGRMAWDQVSPTITSGCTNPSKGRFLHPEQDRGITTREAALLQGFPHKYRFFVEHGLDANALMVGNALPPPFIKRHAQQILLHLKDHRRYR